MFSMLSFRVGLDGSLGSAILNPVLLAVVFDEVKEPSSKTDLLRNSLLYWHFQAQREEIVKHNWYESERAGHDIGFDRALTDWTIRHRSEWRKRWQEELQLH